MGVACRFTRLVMKHRPPSCGPIDSNRYLSWKIFHQKLWKFPENIVDVPDREPPTALDIAAEETRKLIRRRGEKPRKGDFITDGEEHGEIAWVVWSEGQIDTVGVRFPKRKETYSGDQFDVYTSLGGRSRWHIY